MMYFPAEALGITYVREVDLRVQPEGIVDTPALTGLLHSYQAIEVELT
jgi:hypothetical protein